MKNNFILKLSSILFMLISIPLAYANNADFTFLYSPGIKSMNYINTYNADVYLIDNPTTYTTSSGLTVQFKGSFQYLSWEADSFNNTYGPNSKMGLRTSESNAKPTDIYVSGNLEINGESVTDFALAHEHDSHNWWIASNSAKELNSSRLNGTQFTVLGSKGNYYCLNQNHTNSQVVVSTGQCNGSNPYLAPDNISFTFLYGSGINSIEYDNPYNAYPQTPVYVSFLTQESSQLTVTASGDFKEGIQEQANDFNNTYDQNNRVGLNTTNYSAAPTDVFIKGTLKINGNIVATDFALTHEYTSHDWWIATKAGADYGLSFRLLNVQDVNGNQYCFNQTGNNYQVLVTVGTCQYPNDWSHAKSKDFYFQYIEKNKSTGISSLIFTYNGNNDDIHNLHNYLEYVTPGTTYGNDNWGGYVVTIKSKMQSDTETAQTFINKFDPTNPQKNMLRLGKKNGGISTPGKLDFWVEGSLSIDGKVIATDFTLGELDSKPFAQVLPEQWWIASKSGYSFIDTDGFPKMKLNGYCFIISKNIDTAYQTIRVYSLDKNDACPKQN